MSSSTVQESDLEFALTKEVCDNYNLPNAFISLKVSDWKNEDMLIESYIQATYGQVNDWNLVSSQLIRGFNTMEKIKMLGSPLNTLALHVKTHLQKNNVKTRMANKFKKSLAQYKSTSEKEAAVEAFATENYRIHKTLSHGTANDILREAQRQQQEEEEQPQPQQEQQGATLPRDEEQTELALDETNSEDIVTYQPNNRKLLFAWAYLLEIGKHTELTKLTKFLTINNQNIKRLLSDTPDTPGQKLDQGAAKLLDRYSELNKDDILHLRLLLSRIVNTMSPSLVKRTMKLLGRDSFQDMATRSSTRYSHELIDQETTDMLDMIIEIYHDQGSTAAQIAICQSKIPLLQNNPGSTQLVALKALEFVLTHLESWMKPGKTSEADHYGRFCCLFELIFMDTDIKLTSGDMASTTTKLFRALNEKEFGVDSKNGIRGRKIDGIIGHKDLELCLSECKPPSATPSIMVKQLVKNLRGNGCIHHNLQGLSEPGEHVEVYGLDWHGNQGMMYMICDIDDVLVASKIGDLVIPLELYDLAEFKNTIALLLNLKKCLKNQLKRYRPRQLRRKRDLQTAFDSSLSSTPPSTPPSMNQPTVNPKIYFSPAKHQHL